MKLSIIIPSYKEPFLNKTIGSILENADGEIEVIVVLDNYRPNIPIKEDPRVRIIHLEKNRGMRGAINAGLEVARGEFIMKLDAHCMVGQNYDRIMTENCAENWLLVPRRYALDEINWKRDKRRAIRDYHFLNFPTKTHYGYAMCPHVCTALERRMIKRRIPKYDIDDIMTFQGSCWMANRQYFMKHLGFMDDRMETYGSFAGDQLELGLKYWLGYGEVKVIKKTWYAHLSKQKRHYDSGQYSRLHKRTRQTATNRTWSTKHWINNEESNMIHSFSWFIEKFWPVPTWKTNWQEIWDSYKL